ncbi:hypothetical protein BBJ28_00006831 [Nothophytophthora sp. Chile5]|nr:hypothetical protein BBJ28_00006831 [Nothophytophthora sp. Chile5]
MTASEPLSLEEEYAMQRSWREDAKSMGLTLLIDFPSGACEGMAGDVNIFFNDYEDPHVCEMEIMIAEEKYRRKGFAEEAVKLMMAYGRNTPSLSTCMSVVMRDN